MLSPFTRFGNHTRTDLSYSDLRGVDLSLADLRGAALHNATVDTELTYYYDHQAEIDAQLAAWDAEYEQLRGAPPNPLTREQWEARRRAQQENCKGRPR